MDDYQVEIYNAAGDKITTLERQANSGGTLAWDGTTEASDNVVCNGVFICHIEYKVDGESKSMNKLIAVVR